MLPELLTVPSYGSDTWTCSVSAVSSLNRSFTHEWLCLVVTTLFLCVFVLCVPVFSNCFIFLCVYSLSTCFLCLCVALLLCVWMLPPILPPHTAAGGKTAGERATPAALTNHPAHWAQLPSAPDSHPPTGQRYRARGQRPRDPVHAQH